MQKYYLCDDLPGNQHDLDSRERNDAYQSISEVRDSSLPLSTPLRNWPVFNANEIGNTEDNHERYDDQHGDCSTNSSPLIRPLAAVAAILEPGSVPFITSSTIFGEEDVRMKGSRSGEFEV